MSGLLGLLGLVFIVEAFKQFRKGGARRVLAAALMLIGIACSVVATQWLITLYA